MKKQTVGKIASDLLARPQEKISIIEQQEAMQKEYMKNLLDAVDRGYKEFPNDFFIEVQTKNEKLLPNVFRNYFIPRSSCPTPNYDQSVFRYNRQIAQVEYIWTVPSRDASFYLRDNAAEVVTEERQLLYFVLKFDDGTLFKICKKFNGEEFDSPKLIKEVNGKSI